MSLLGLLVALVHPAAADDALRARCLDLLSAYEDPATAEDWRALGEGAAPELLGIAKDTTLSHTRRGNAMVALGYFPSDGNRAFLAGVAASTAEDGLFRRKAVYALGNGWGDGAVPELTAALAAEDVQLRAAAAKVLGKVGTPAAKEALRARLGTETDRMVRTEITKHLGER